MREYSLKVDGYRRLMYGMDSRMRFLAYCAVKPHLKDQSLSIYDFMPLMGDPTLEQIAEAQQANLEKEMIEARRVKEAVMSAFNNYGRV